MFFLNLFLSLQEAKAEEPYSALPQYSFRALLGVVGNWQLLLRPVSDLSYLYSSSSTLLLPLLVNYIPKETGPFIVLLVKQ